MNDGPVVLTADEAEQIRKALRWTIHGNCERHGVPKSLTDDAEWAILDMNAGNARLVDAALDFLSEEGKADKRCPKLMMEINLDNPLETDLMGGERPDRERK